MEQRRQVHTATGIAIAILLVFLVKYVMQGRWELVYADIAASVIGIGLFLYLYRRTNQDIYSYTAFLLLLVLHVAYLYPYTVFGVRWDHYTHYLAGLAVGLFADRLFFAEKWQWGQRFVMIIIFVMGIGAIHEVVEWLGYGILGEGEGFLYYGAGDEGEWRNAMLDLIFNFLGASTIALYRKIRQNFKT